MAAGSLTLGGNMSVALGPLGRNGEASSSVNTNGGVAMMRVMFSDTKQVAADGTILQVFLFQDKGPLWRCERRGVRDRGTARCKCSSI